MGLFDNEGVWQEETEKLEDIIENFYENLFKTDHPDPRHIQEVLRHVPCSVTSEFNESLLKPYSKDEIYAALLQMHPCKAPGPNGMHAIFYQRFWHIVGNDVTKFVSDILHGFASPSQVNKTNIVLIPKVKNPIAMVEFRLISLCNVLYKLTTKTLVMRLKNILP